MVNHTHLFEIYDNIRRTALSATGTLSALGVSLAALLAAITLLKVYLDYTNGKARGTWDFVRPFLIIILVSISGPMIRMADDVLTRTVNAVHADTHVTMEQNKAMTALAIKALDEESRGALHQVNEEQKAKLTNGEWTWNEIGNAIHTAWLNVTTGTMSAIFKMKDFLNMAELSAHGMKNMLDEEYGLTPDETNDNPFSGRGFMLGLVCLIADKLFFIFDGFAQMTLIIMAFLAPFIFAFSILPWYSKGIQNFFLTYIQLSFWRVVISATEWTSAIARKGMYTSRTAIIHNTNDKFDALASSGTLAMGLTILGVTSILLAFNTRGISKTLVKSAGLGGMFESVTDKFRKLAMKPMAATAAAPLTYAITRIRRSGQDKFNYFNYKRKGSQNIFKRAGYGAMTGLMAAYLNPTLRKPTYWLKRASTNWTISRRSKFMAKHPEFRNYASKRLYEWIPKNWKRTRKVASWLPRGITNRMYLNPRAKHIKLLNQQSFTVANNWRVRMHVKPYKWAHHNLEKLYEKDIISTIDFQNIDNIASSLTHYAQWSQYSKLRF